METYHLPHFLAPYSTVHVALFTNLSNAPQIRRRLIEASTMPGAEGDVARAQVDYGFLEARLLVSRLHLLTAIQTTLLNSFPSHPFSSDPPPSSDPSPSSSVPLPSSASSPLSTTTTTTTTTTISSSPQPSTRSHNLHSELLLALSPNNNISDSIRRHGLSDATDALVVVKIAGPEVGVAEVWSGIEGVVSGELKGLGELDGGGLADWGRVDKAYKLSDVSRLPLSPEEILQTKIDAVVNAVAIKSIT